MISVTQSYMSSWLPTLNFYEQPLTQNQGDRLFDVVVQAAEEIFGIDKKTAVRLATVVRSVCTHEDLKDYELTFSEEEVLFSCTVQQMYAFGSFMKSVGQKITRTAAGIGGAVKSISREGGRKLNVTANKINRLTHAGSKHLGATVNNRVYNNEGLWSRMKSGFKTAAEIKGAKQDNLNGINNVRERGKKLLSAPKPTQSTSTAANAKLTSTPAPATTTSKPATTPAPAPQVNPAPGAKPQNPNANSLKDKISNFGKGFTDQKNGFMGVKGGFKGVGEWAKNNKGQAAVAAVGTAAAAYGAYRMLRPKQQQPQQTNVTVVNKQQ